LQIAAGNILTLLVLALAGYEAWTVPTTTSDVKHHAADETNKAYDEGADFYLFNRCSMYIVVDGKKASFQGEEIADSCFLANPLDGAKESELTKKDQS
jgi:hypothetical protein